MVAVVLFVYFQQYAVCFMVAVVLFVYFQQYAVCFMVAVVLFVVYSAIRSMFYGSCGIIRCIFSNTQYVLW